MKEKINDSGITDPSPKKPILDILVNASYNNCCLWVSTRVDVKVLKLEIIMFFLLI